MGWSSATQYIVCCLLLRVHYEELSSALARMSLLSCTHQSNLCSWGEILYKGHLNQLIRIAATVIICSGNELCKRCIAWRNQWEHVRGIFSRGVTVEGKDCGVVEWIYLGALGKFRYEAEMCIGSVCYPETYDRKDWWWIKENPRAELFGETASDIDQ